LPTVNEMSPFQGYELTHFFDAHSPFKPWFPLRFAHG